jgi:hypothetical protein
VVILSLKRQRVMATGADIYGRKQVRVTNVYRASMLLRCEKRQNNDSIQLPSLHTRCTSYRWLHSWHDMIVMTACSTILLLLLAYMLQISAFRANHR